MTICTHLTLFNYVCPINTLAIYSIYYRPFYLLFVYSYISSNEIAFFIVLHSKWAIIVLLLEARIQPWFQFIVGKVPVQIVGAQHTLNSRYSDTIHSYVAHHNDIVIIIEKVDVCH